MTIGDVNKKECRIWLVMLRRGGIVLVMLMKRYIVLVLLMNRFIFSDVHKIGKWQLVMFMNRGIVFDWWFTDRRYRFGDVNEKVYFSDVNKLGKWQLVMSMNRIVVFNWWCSWIGGIILVMLMKRGIVLVMLMSRFIFSDVQIIDKWQLVMLMNRGIVFDWWFSWIGGIVLVMLMKRYISVMLTN